jgi:hypothetical protein
MGFPTEKIKCLPDNLVDSDSLCYLQDCVSLCYFCPMTYGRNACTQCTSHFIYISFITNWKFIFVLKNMFFLYDNRVFPVTTSLNAIEFFNAENKLHANNKHNSYILSTPTNLGSGSHSFSKFYSNGNY